MFSSHPYSSPLRTYRREKAPRENEQILQIVREETDLRITFSARADQGGDARPAHDARGSVARRTSRCG